MGYYVLINYDAKISSKFSIRDENVWNIIHPLIPDKIPKDALCIISYDLSTRVVDNEMFSNKIVVQNSHAYQEYNQHKIRIECLSKAETYETYVLDVKTNSKIHFTNWSTGIRVLEYYRSYVKVEVKNKYSVEKAKDYIMETMSIKDDLFVNNYSRNVGYIRAVRDVTERPVSHFEILSDKQLYYTQGVGVRVKGIAYVGRKFICNNPKMFIGMKLNTLPNMHQYPYIPTCYEKDHSIIKGTSTYNYIHDIVEEGSKVKFFRNDKVIKTIVRYNVINRNVRYDLIKYRDIYEHMKGVNVNNDANDCMNHYIIGYDKMYWMVVKVDGILVSEENALSKFECRIKPPHTADDEIDVYHVHDILVETKRRKYDITVIYGDRAAMNRNIRKIPARGLSQEGFSDYYGIQNNIFYVPSEVLNLINITELNSFIL
ncbi:hypothetical protein K502DRAFT_330546 [Neoconidiobolus thromboides FSU 785]|nr:hypothetical protein K502DRAFT_330546 [Neoconidiobolus thromboides FSU 785]